MDNIKGKLLLLIDHKMIQIECSDCPTYANDYTSREWIVRKESQLEILEELKDEILNLTN